MKVIDLLNKIANGEEVPKKITQYCKCFDEIKYWKLCTRGYGCYEADDDIEEYLFDYLTTDMLNDEVEIIEEDKKDKEIEIYVNGEKVDITDIYEPLKQGEYFYKENGKWYVHKLKNVSKIIEEDKKIETINNFTSNVGAVDENNIEEYIHKLFEQDLILYLKVNQIIDFINKGE